MTRNALTIRTDSYARSAVCSARCEMFRPVVRLCSMHTRCPSTHGALGDPATQQVLLQAGQLRLVFR